jgi:putative membrane-bound dehydrogenase-like protein
MCLRQVIVFCLLATLVGAADKDFPLLPDDLSVSLYARDPLVRNPCAITFDSRGRLCVGMGPQYRSPKPDTEGDSVFILIDRDGNGMADERRQFASGFNSIQGLAWKGRDLWVANAPELTIVRDLDGDDVADEYVRLYTDLGNLEHGLHGLNWGPDGKLYMSKGNSKGHSKPPHPVAPKPFRDLWGVKLPDVPDLPKPIVFPRGKYEKTYHDPRDDWGLCGGILRCDADGSNLEIVSRGMRNPWDICFDDGFDWLGTDNDQTLGDKILAPFYGSHFGWGHMWSYDWKGDDHLPSAPSAGPLFEGSGAGVIHCNVAGWPAKYRDIFLINDWLQRKVFIYRATWNGAWMQPANENFDLFAHADRGRSMKQSSGRSFDPVDIEVGPDGAIYISSWGRNYGAVMKNGEMANQGRIYRIWPRSFKPAHRVFKPIPGMSVAQLIEELKGDLAVRRVEAQEELVRQGASVRGELISALNKDSNNRRLETWGLWALGRMKEPLPTIASKSDNARIQTLRILAHRNENHSAQVMAATLEDNSARIRHESVLALHQLGPSSHVGELLNRAAAEQDRIVYYSVWQALRTLMSETQLRAALKDDRAGVRRAALLALLEDDRLSDAEIQSMTKDRDSVTAGLAADRLGGKADAIIKGSRLAGNSYAGKKEGKKTVAESKSTGTPPLTVVRSIRSVTGNRYEEAMLEAGTKAYVDRGHRINDVPALLNGETFIRSANNDADQASGTGLTLDLRYPSTVYLADDMRGQELPRWARGKFEKTDMSMRVGKKHVIYQTGLPAGEHFFGPNREDVQARKGNYLLIIQPQVLSPPAEPTKAEQVLPLVAQADVGHGRNLFLQKAGATCSVCHQMEGRGNIFAPDLSDIGKRADADFIVRAILDPSAEITEGFAAQTIITKGGNEFSGIVLSETGRALRMAMGGGHIQQIAKADIKSRIGTHQSAMPNIFHSLLKPADVAAITRYLLEAKTIPVQITANKGPARKSTKKTVKVTIHPTQPDALSRKSFGNDSGFGLTVTDDRMKIAFKSQEVAAYHYRHEKVWRPFFANLKTPSGVQVTRNFPPQKGDPRDHWDMHPGLSLGFAVLNDVNFWHNKDGFVAHRGFSGVSADGAVAKFSTTNHYLDTEGNILTRESAHYSVRRNDAGILLTIDTRITATRDIFFGVKEEMGLALRAATPITVKYGQGSILSAAGGKDEKGTWGKTDQWWDYFGPIGERSVGMQIMSAPGNPEVWSHSRNYGVLVANPFPVDIKKNRGRKVNLSKGADLRLRFGVQIHDNPKRDDYDPAVAYHTYLKTL